MYIHAGEAVRVAEFDLNNSHCGPLRSQEKGVGPFLFFKSIQKTFQLKSRSPKSISGEEGGDKITRFGPHVQSAARLCV